MKKLYAFLVLGLIGFMGNAQIVNIPDANFKTKLLAARPTSAIACNSAGVQVRIDTNQDGNIQVSEALLIYTLNVTYSSIADLTGIEAFTNLRSLICPFNSLTSINVSALPSLVTLNCNNNQLTTLTTGANLALETVICYTNQLTALNFPNAPNLNSLNCGVNFLTAINLSHPLALRSLVIYRNPFQTINLNQYTNLENLDVSVSSYTALNIDSLINLIVLDVRANDPAIFPLNDANMPSFTHLKELYTTDSQVGNVNYHLLPVLEKLECNNTGLTSINVSLMPNLKNLQCENNQLTTLDLTPLLNLEQISIHDNLIDNLIVGNHPNLDTFYCGSNIFSSLDLSNCPNLDSFSCNVSPLLTTVNIKNGKVESYINFANTPNMRYICADEGQIATIQSSINTSGNTNCHVNTYCSFEPGGTFYTIQGNHQWDTTGNGCDSSDLLFPNMKFRISNGTATSTIISGNDGSYQYDVPAGTYTVTPVLENPSYFTVTSSNTGSVVFPTAASPFVRDFCISSLGNNPDLEVALYPLTDARPGFDNRFALVYKNKGNVLQNGSVTFTYDDAIQDLVFTSVAPSTETAGNLTWNFTNLFPFETRSVAIVFNLNMPTEIPALIGGEVLNYTGTITSSLTDITPNDNACTAVQTTTNSYDPNDKTCAEGTTIAPSMVGQYVHYVIRFENTGTANAVNIVVKDVIDTTKFDISTLIPQAGSAPFTTKISNTNQVEFVFENINLPFDDENNDGYVAFKIKTKPTLVIGNTFSNTANIYFDYNFPIVTNTYTTTVATLGNHDFEFNSVFSLSPVPTKDRLTISTKQDVVMSSVSIYNTLGQLVQVNTNPSDTIDVSSLKTGSYFIKIVSDKGSATGKFIKE